MTTEFGWIKHRQEHTDTGKIKILSYIRIWMKRKKKTKKELLEMLHSKNKIEVEVGK
jgi:hypothetical protein